MDEAWIPRVGRCFKSEEEAHEFYCTYAEKAGFEPKKANKSGNTRYFRCNRFGKGEYYKKDEAERKTGKTTKKTSCLAMIKLKFRRDEESNEKVAEIEQVRLEHNHVLLPKPTETKQMRAHKNKDPLLLDYVDDLQANDVPNHCVRNIIRGMHGGEENMTEVTPCLVVFLQPLHNEIGTGHGWAPLSHLLNTNAVECYEQLHGCRMSVKCNQKMYGCMVDLLVIFWRSVQRRASRGAGRSGQTEK